MKKTFKMIGIFIALVLGLLVITIALFLNISPQFGKSPTNEQKIEYAKSGHYKEGKFTNQTPTVMDINFWKMIKKLVQASPNRKPRQDIIVEKLNPTVFENSDMQTSRLTWFGHSTFLLELDGKKILIDPMFSETPAPLPILGPKRFSAELPIEIEELPKIDAIILSHDHYDHLDYKSIQKLKSKVDRYYMPLGVANHLVEWGIEREKIHELNWWDSIDFDGIELVCSPAQHFSGRGLFDRSTTLWCSWVITGKADNIYFSGDSGYGKHFKEIGEKYGPFDISLMECGQYNEEWKVIHMMPEETVQAAVDLNSKLVLPIHWGAFTLAFHDWTDPIIRVTKKAKELNMPLTTPKIGQTIILGSEDFPTERWWETYM